MIILIIYLIGIFITPIILKKFTSLPSTSDSSLEPLDKETIIMVSSILWPLGVIIWILFKFMLITIWIYNKL
jgi:hypothetical protein